MAVPAARRARSRSKPSCSPKPTTSTRGAGIWPCVVQQQGLASLALEVAQVNRRRDLVAEGLVNRTRSPAWARSSKEIDHEDIRVLFLNSSLNYFNIHNVGGSVVGGH